MRDTMPMAAVAVRQQRRVRWRCFSRPVHSSLLAILLGSMMGCSGEQSPHDSSERPESEPGEDGEWGSFPIPPETRWLDEGQKMELTRTFVYIDPDGDEWIATSGSIIDGSSIPRPLWTVIGSPFVGKHRNASIVHDVYCVTRSEPWKTVHRMYYEGCRCGGVGWVRSKLMYGAVYHFGPRWSGDGSDLQSRVQELGLFDPSAADADAVEDSLFDELRQWIESTDPELDDIEDFTFQPR